MYVCICHAVTDRQIREAVSCGARSLMDVQCKVPVGGCCGRCVDSAHEVIQEELARRQRTAA